MPLLELVYINLYLQFSEEERGAEVPIAIQRTPVFGLSLLGVTVPVLLVSSADKQTSGADVSAAERLGWHTSGGMRSSHGRLRTRLAVCAIRARASGAWSQIRIPHV